jgi:hypothetical protein
VHLNFTTSSRNALVPHDHWAHKLPLAVSAGVSADEVIVLRIGNATRGGIDEGVSHRSAFPLL